MKQEKVLDFSAFHRLNEEETSKSGSAVDALIDLFFQAYSSTVTKIGDYKDAVSDLLGIAEAPAEKKGDVMADVISKISKKVDAPYMEAASKMLEAAKKLKNVYGAVIQTDEGKKALVNINKAIYNKIKSYVEELKKAARETPRVKETKNESLEVEQGHMHLFEKNTFIEERKDLITKLTPVMALVTTLLRNPPSDSLKSECRKAKANLDKIIAEINDENKWESMKRRERKDELVKIGNDINDIYLSLIELQSNTLNKLGLDQKISKAIKEVSDLVSSAIEILNKKEETEIATPDAPEEGKDGKEKKEDSDKEETFTEIKSGKVDSKNLTKKGENLEKIKGIQDKMNSILPEKDKLKADGLYGENTEKAITSIAKMFKNIAPDLLNNVDGKSLTPGFQEFLSKLEKNKDKISDIFSGKPKESPKEKTKEK